MKPTYKIIVFSAFLAFRGTSLATELLVPSQYPTIQSAIDVAVDGDEIIVSLGIYYENVCFNGKSIVLRSTEPANPTAVANTIIDGYDRGPVVTFSGTESAACVLSGFTITNGCGNLVFGGGIYGNGTRATIEHNIVRGNFVNPSWFPSSAFGGGLSDCNGTIQYNIISDNGVYCDEGRAAGGGLYNCDGKISNNIIANNIVSGLVWDIGEGGGLYDCDGIIQNNTIFGNFACCGGSGMSRCNGTIEACIIWQNNANGGAQIIASTAPSYSCIQDWLGGGIGNIDTDPCFFDADANDYHLKSEGWRWDSVRHRWTYDDVTSRCIDAGNPGSPLGDELLSVPDDPENIWGQNLRIDMGAFGGTAEASIPPYDWALLSDVTNDGISDFNDLETFSTLWLNTGEQLYADFNRDGIVDLFDFALLAQDWLAQTSWR